MTYQTIALTAAALAIILPLTTFLLPQTTTVTRSATMPAAPDAIFNLVSSNQGYQVFNPYKSADPNLKIDLFGPDQGVGSGFHFDGKDGTGSQTVAAVEQDKSVLFHIDLGVMGKPIQRVTLTPVANGTNVTWDMESDAGYNPIKRVFGLFLDGMLGGTLDQGLANLNQATAS